MLIKHPLEPIIDSDSQIIILGSFPSIKSREENYYYMNKQNRFWKVLSSIYNYDFVNASKVQKTNKLKELKIALYDVVVECEIVGSSDSTIKNEKVLDINKFIALSNISKIYLNGKKAYELFISNYQNLKDIAYLMPSTSPANAVYTLDKLIAKWQVIKER